MKRFIFPFVASLFLSISGCDKSTSPLMPYGPHNVLNLKGKCICSLRLTEHYIYACAGRDGLFRRFKSEVKKEWQDISNEWEYLGFSATGINLGVRDIYVPPQQEDVLFVALANNDTGLTAVYKSTDSGSQWFAADSGLGIEQPRNSSHVYKDAAVLFASAFSPETIFTTSRHGFAIFRTRNGGRFWETIIKKEDPDVVPSTISRILTFSYHPARADELWAGGMQGGQFYSWPMFFRSTDGGDSWRSARLGTVSDNAAWSIAIAGPSGLIYVGLSGFIMMSQDDGATWTKVLNGNQNNDRMQVLIDPNRDSHLLVGGGTSLFESFDSGTTWQKLPPPATFISTLTWDRITGSVYAGTDSSGVYVKLF